MDNLLRMDRDEAPRFIPLPNKRPRPRAGPLEDAIEGFTYADYETWNDDIRREIIRGKSYLMSAPVSAHQSILTELIIQFGTFFRDGMSCKVYPAPYDVRLFAPYKEGAEDDKSDQDVVQPDLSIVCDPRKRRVKGCQGPPELVVEILSESNRSHDTLLKFNRYREAGVQEYWIIDPEAETLTRHLLEEVEGKRYYRTVVHGPEEQVRPFLFPDCLIDLARVFAAADQAG